MNKREECIEAMARAAWAAYVDIPQIRDEWMDDEWWAEFHVDRMAKWPHDTGLYPNADDFRRAAAAALDAALKVLSEPDAEMIKAGQATECVHGDENCGAQFAFPAMLKVVAK